MTDSDYQIVDFEGLLAADGRTWLLQSGQLVAQSTHIDQPDYMAVEILAQASLGPYKIACGSSSSHGSIGFVAMRHQENNKALWSLLTYASNPFEHILVKTGLIIAVSSSGAIFRSDPDLKHPQLLLW